MFIKKKLKYFTRPKQISPDLSGESGDFRIVCIYIGRHFPLHLTMFSNSLCNFCDKIEGLLKCFKVK